MTDDRVNILVVDDLPDKLLSMQVILESLGQNVLTARSGREALRKLTEDDVAVVLLDVYMPEMNGFETATLIRQRKKFAHVPIIFVTAYADEMQTAQGYSLGAVDYILSPVVPEILRAKVSVFVELYKKGEAVKRAAEERVALAREQAARAAAEEATRRSNFLAEAGAALSRSLDYEQTLRSLARLAVPALADVAAVTQADDRRRPRQTELAWTDADAVRTARREAVADVPLADAVARTLATGKPVFLEQIPSAEQKGLPAGFTLRSAAVVPLVAQGRTLGALLVAVGPSGRSLGPSDFTLVEELAMRAAIAVDNARLYRDLHESDRRKNEFLSMLAHELRNPLAPIRNALQILHHYEAENGQTRWARDVIDRQVHHIVRMVDDLLDVARITRGKIKLQPEPVEVAAVVARAVETSRPLVDARKHELAVDLSAEPLWVHGDPTRLAQVVTNLLNNAAKYTEEGGKIRLSAGRDGSAVVIRVRDSGVGIPEDMLASVFDLFTQADRSLDRAQGGLGIGLTLVKRLVELHKGTVVATSAGPGQGSEFVVRLPALVESRRPEAPANGNGAVPAAGRRRRILVVDDNVDSADSLAVLLQLMGHEVCQAHTGPAALEAADAFRPDVALLDIGLPGMDGYEVGRRLRLRWTAQDLTLVALTGYGQADDQRRSREAGFQHHLVKPADLPTLEYLLKGPAAREPVAVRAGNGSG